MSTLDTPINSTIWHPLPTGGLHSHGQCRTRCRTTILTTSLESAFTTFTTGTWPTTFISMSTFTTANLPSSMSNTVPHYSTHHGNPLCHVHPHYQNGTLNRMSDSHHMIEMHQTNGRNYASCYDGLIPGSTNELCVIAMP